jgi:cytochrome c biogenesis protein CcmG/thiol:disulfide interchange protein DsbE
MLSAMETTASKASPKGRPRIGRWLAAALVAAFLALLAYGLASKGTDDRIDRALGDGKAPAAPGFSLSVLERGALPMPLERRLGPALARGRVSLGDLRGTPVVLNMWASWCNPCREEAGRLQAGWRALGPRGVLFLGLDIQDLEGDARAFSHKYGMTYPSVREPGRDVANRYGATGIPETFFLDARGRVVAHVIGVVSARQLADGAGAAQKGVVAGTSTGGRSFKVR